MNENKNETAGNTTDDNVRVLSEEENYFYEGDTIDGGVDPDAKIYRANDYMSNFYIRNFNLGGDSLLTKVVLGLIAVGVVLFILFIALPVALVVLGVLLTIWLVLEFFQRR